MAFLVGYAILAYNSMVGTVESVSNAWSLLDVELRRRHDLIPELERVVSANRDYEAAVQTELATLRSLQAHDLPEHSSDQAVARFDPEMRSEWQALRSVFAKAEAYPHLSAQPAFSALQQELVNTESRIEMARHFYNNSVGIVRDRSQVFPGVLVAWLAEVDTSAEFTELADGDPAEAPPAAAWT